MRNPATARTRILVVDDEHLIADTIVAILRRDGFEAAPAYSGSEAVQEASKLCPDIMLSDFYMPDMNGLETAKLVRGLCPRVKVVFLSGHAPSLEFLGHLDKQEFDYELLSKPIDPDVLLAALRG
jgi:CheY-like chemotaxis protein